MAEVEAKDVVSRMTDENELAEEDSVDSTGTPVSHGTVAAQGATGKTKKASQQDSNTDFLSIISGRIEELEKGLGNTSNQGERDVLKQRKKQLREVVKYVSDKANTTDDRINFIQAKYTQMAQELLKLEKQQLESQAQLDVVTRERDKAQDGLRRSNALRDKLEELCRQLQKENKEVLEEARKIRDDEAAARLALQSRFQSAIQDVTSKMDAQAAERSAQLAENDTLRAKLADVLAQFETFHQLVQKKDVELQLCQARLDQQAAMSDTLSQKAELLEKANAQLLEAHKAASGELDQLSEMRRVNAALQAANTELKEQLDSYYTKFNEFQNTLTKSNQMFDSLKKELESGAKMRNSLVRERDELRRRVAAADAGLVQALEEKQGALQQSNKLSALLAAVEGVDPEEVKKLKSQKEALEGLCRTLRAQLKGSTSSSGGADATATPSAAAAAAEASGTASPDASVATTATPGSTGVSSPAASGAGSPADRGFPPALSSQPVSTSSSSSEQPAVASPTTSSGGAGKPMVNGPRSPRYQGHGYSKAANTPLQELQAPSVADAPPVSPGQVVYGGVLLPASLDCHDDVPRIVTK